MCGAETRSRRLQDYSSGDTRSGSLTHFLPLASPDWCYAVRDVWIMPLMHLLERQDQLEVLNRCFQNARGASGKLVLIAGEAGFGKSSLVERFVSEHRRDACALRGAAMPSLRRVHSHPSTRSLRKRRSSLAVPYGRMNPGIGCSVLCSKISHDRSEPACWCSRMCTGPTRRPSISCDISVGAFNAPAPSSSPRIATKSSPRAHPVRLALGELAGNHVIAHTLDGPLTRRRRSAGRGQWTRTGIPASNYRR